MVGRDQSLRVECRIPGADANPYLAFAAMLAAGLDGIGRKLEPPDMFRGNLYQAEDAVGIPRSLGMDLGLGVREREDDLAVPDELRTEEPRTPGRRDHHVALGHEALQGRTLAPQALQSQQRLGIDVRPE